MQSITSLARFVALWLFVWELVTVALHRGAGWDHRLSIWLGIAAAGAVAGACGRRWLNGQRSHREPWDR